MVDLFGINRFQNAKDTIQKIQSSGGGKGASNRIPSYGKDSVPKGPYREVNGYPIKVKAGLKKSIFLIHRTINKN